ncbi:MAG: hypothetical protein QOG91_447, partial [Candidatus Parcubacteria bacterium]|nr:hypothetical protein [Candidatus Parcubacteria bacterium]
MSNAARTGITVVILLIIIVIGWIWYSNSSPNTPPEPSPTPSATTTPVAQGPDISGTGLSDSGDSSGAALEQDAAALD